VINAFLNRQFLIFLATSGTAAAVNFGSRIVYSHWVDFPVAVALAFVTAMTTAFILARLFVFRESRQKIHRSALFFLLVNLVALAQTWIISMVLAYYALPAMGVIDHVPEIAHAAGVVAPVFTSYIGHKRWSFR
jgi:putative flippase GtrA